MRRALLAAVAALTIAGPAAAQDWRHDNRRWIERQRIDREREFHHAQRRMERQHWRDERRAHEDRLRRQRWRHEQRHHWRERHW